MAKTRCETAQLDLGEVSGMLYKALDWLAAHGMLGCTPEQVALFLLTREVGRMLTSGEFEKRAAFNKWLDAEMAQIRARK